MRPVGRDRPWLHVTLFVLTGVSVGCTFFFGMNGGVESNDWTDRATGSMLFALCVMLCLGAHELGHWVMVRVHGVDASLPWFIPLPLLGFGTLGAVIRLRGRIPTRDALVDIGAAGPLAGLLIALPLTAAGLYLSHVAPAPISAASGSLPMLSGLSLLRELLSALGLEGLGSTQALRGAQVFGDSLFTAGLQRLIKGPLPAGQELYAHPVFIAAWFGLLVTVLNLIPVGQLDGGHITHALFGRRAERIGRVFAGVLLFLAFFASVSWLVWFLVIAKAVRFTHPPVVHEHVPLSPLSMRLGLTCLVLLVLLFMPVPVDIM